jgi:pimeloyl-[acyl-carrier protein] methyl ester esterase
LRPNLKHRNWGHEEILVKWLLLRGLTREIRHWGEFAPLLDKATDGILCLDLPGVGTEYKRAAPITIRGNTEDIRERFLDARGKNGATESWGILGISLGGMIALDWVYRYPYDFKKIVVINSSSKDSGPIWQRLTAYGGYQMAKIVLNKSGYSREKECMKMVSNVHQNNEKMLHEFARYREEAPVAPATAVKQIGAATQFMLPPKIKIPALILASLKDNMVDVRCSKLMAERLNAQIKFHPTAGHDLPLDDAKWCVECVSEFERIAHNGSEAVPSRGSEANVD